MTLTLNLDDEQKRGLTAAREAYNASLPEDSTERKETDEAYAAWVMEQACVSYAVQYPA